jgi:replicative DNA helicase
VIDTTAVEKVPPHSLAAEQSALGSMLIDQSAAEIGAEVLRAQDFYRQAHGSIFDSISAVVHRAEPVDLITVTEELRAANKIEEIGGAAYLNDLIEAVPSSANVEYYCKIVQSKAMLRRLIGACSEISGKCYGEVEDAWGIVDEAERAVFNVGQRHIRQYFHHLGSLLHEAFERIDTLYREKGVTQGLATGFESLDFYTSGLQNSDFIIVAARPSIGKTSLVLNMATTAAITKGSHTGVPTAIFSIEMSKEQMVQRLICQQARIDSHRLRTGYLPDEDWIRVTEGVEALHSAPIYVDDSADISALEMRSKCRRLMNDIGLGLVIVDYLQLVRPHSKTDNRVQQISEIARALKSMARELSVPVVACSQLSRAVEQRPDKRPILSDLRESGSIEAEADLVVLLYRQAYYDRKARIEDMDGRYAEAPSEPMGHEAEVIIAKQRNGPTGVIKLMFVPQYTSFFDMEKYREEM